MKEVGDKIDDLWLLCGTYSRAGETTCVLYTGYLDFETQDAKTFVSWGVNHLKYDNYYYVGNLKRLKYLFHGYNKM